MPRLRGRVLPGGGSMGDPAALGRSGEDAAVAYLTSRGLQVVERNWRCRYGELDIVARDGPVLVFCEVKTRRGTRFGSPVDAITVAKAARLRRLAGLWLAQGAGHQGQLRIDVIGILWHRDGTLAIEHLRGVA